MRGSRGWVWRTQLVLSSLCVMMRRLCFTTTLFALVACGGSSSESPWPREPANLDGDPSGENAPDGNVIDVTQLPNNYDEGEGGAGADDDEDPEAE